MKANGVEREGSYLNHDESQELRSDCKMAGLEDDVAIANELNRSTREQRWNCLLYTSPSPRD